MTIEAKWSDFSSLDGTRTLAAANQLLPKWVTLLLVILIGWQLAKLTWTVMPGSAAGDALAPSLSQLGAASGDATGPGEQANIQSIASAHLFGEASEAPIDNTPPPATENLEEFRGNLTLKGTVAASGDSDSVAIIADQSNDEKVYGIGDPVVGGTTLHAIYSDRVVLNDNGVLKALNLPREFPDGAPQVRRRNTSVSRTVDNNSSIQNVVARNVTKLADVIRPTPYFVAGQQQGYRVYPGRDRKQFAALGLRPGDLIKDIDGAALTDPQQAMKIFQNLGTADQVSVTVERNGQPEVLILRTDQLNLDRNE